MRAMHILMIPGFIGHPDQGTFRDLEKDLIAQGHRVTKLAWPHFPHELDQYNMTNTITHAKEVAAQLPNRDLAIVGFSMGGVIATIVAAEVQPAKLGLIVSPYQAGSEDDLAGKYKNWKETGYRKVKSSKYGELNVPYSFIEDAHQYNALPQISHVTGAKLFIAGEHDDRVPKMTVRRFFDAASEPKEWHEIAGMHHEYQYEPAILAQVNEIIVKFVNSYPPTS